MARISPLMVLPPVIFAGLAAMFYLGMQREDPDALPSTLEGRIAPAIQEIPVADLPTFTREALDAPGIKIVNFFASWCAPCRVEHPHLVEFAETYPVYGINRDVTDDQALAFLDELGNPYTGVVGDPRNRQSIDWGVYGLPETFFIDGNGEVILHFRGPITERVIESRIAPALGAAIN